MTQDVGSSHLVEAEPVFDAQIEADDADSTLGDDDFLSSTKSLESTTEQYTYEHGRRYHGYKSGRYAFPNDEGENDREDMKHHLTRLLLSDHLHASSFTTSPIKVLDVGTGTGIWAIEFADDNPASVVIGVDLSPIQPTLVPPNLEFQVDDIEDEWTWQPSCFDFINVRYMATAIRDWNRLLSQAHEALTPGGKIELVDMDLHYTSDDGTVREDNRLLQFVDIIVQSGPRLGIDLNACRTFDGALKSVGYVNVKTELYKLPFGPWAKNRRLKEIGYFHREQFLQGAEGIAMGCFGRGMGWSKNEIDVMLAGVRADARNIRIHGYWLVQFTTAEKAE